MSDISFSALIIGAMRLGQWGAKYDTQAYESFIEGCINLGLTDFDHADIYGSHSTEAEFGEVLKHRPDLRKKVELTTKCGIMYPSPNRADIKIKHYNFSKNHILESVEKSLTNLNVEQIKLLLLHRPDYLMDAEEVAIAFEELESSGKVKYFGVSNFRPSEFALLNSHFPLANNQIQFSLAHPQLMQDGDLFYFQKENVSLTAWSPLGGGSLLKDTEETPLNSCLKKMAEKYNCGIDQILYAWIFKHPSKIIPVTGSSQLARIKRALDATKIVLSREDWYELLEMRMGDSVA